MPEPKRVFRLKLTPDSLVLEDARDGNMIGELWNNGTLILFRDEFTKIDADRNTIALQLKGTE